MLNALYVAVSFTDIILLVVSFCLLDRTIRNIHVMLSSTIKSQLQANTSETTKLQVNCASTVVCSLLRNTNVLLQAGPASCHTKGGFV